MSKDWKNGQRILQAIFEDPQDEIYDYVEAHLDGKDAANLFPDVQAYLDDCGGQDDDYQAVLSLLKAERTGTLEVLPPSFQLNLKKFLPPGFKPELPSAPIKGLIWHINKANHLVVQISQELLDSLSRPLQGQPSFVRAEQTQLFEEEIQGQIDHMDVKIEANQNLNDKEMCSLTVEVRKAGLGMFDYEGTEVVLKDPQTTGESLDRQKTDSFGKVKFDQIPRSRLSEISIEID